MGWAKASIAGLDFGDSLTSIEHPPTSQREALNPFSQVSVRPVPGGDVDLQVAFPENSIYTSALITREHAEDLHQALGRLLST